MRKILYVLILSTILSAAVMHTFAFAEDDISVILNGKKLEFVEKPFIKDNRVMIPLRAVAETLNLRVEWNDSVTEVSVPFYMGKYPHTKMSIIDGKMFSSTTTEISDAVPIIKDNRTFVPVRFFADSLNYDINWNEKTKTVEIVSEQEYYIHNYRFGITLSGTPEYTAKINNSSPVIESALTVTNSNGEITLITEELFLYSAGDIKVDAKNLGIEPAGDIEKRTDMEILPVFAEKEINGKEVIKSILLKNHANYLTVMHFTADSKALKNKSRTISAIEAAVSSLSASNFSISALERTHNINFRTYKKSLQINIPAYYAFFFTSSVTDYYDNLFENNTINIVKTADSSRNPATLSICFGEKTQFGLRQGNPIQKEAGLFMGEAIEWIIYDGYMEALMEKNGETYHLYAYTDNAEIQKEFINIINKTKKGDLIVSGA